MNRLLLFGVSMVAALSLGLPDASAELQKKKRRPSFLESLFGIGSFEGNSRERRLRRKHAWWQDNGDIRFFWEEPRANTATAKPKKRKGVATAYIDPEDVQGVGLGNLTYVLPKLVPVLDRSFASMASEDAGPSAIRLVLSDAETEIRALPEIRTAVLAHYKATAFRPLWTERDRLTERGQSLLRLLADANAEGLNANRYLPPVLDSYDSPAAAIAGDSLAAAQLDVGLTVAALTYARHVSGGAFEPARLSKYHHIEPEYAKPATVLQVLAYSPFPIEYLKSLAPAHPAYQALKAELAALAVPQKPDETFPDGKRVKVAQKDWRIILLRERLAREGFVTANAADLTPETAIILDKHLSKALKAYQKSKGLAQTGHLDEKTVRQLNGETPQSLREKLIVNMERLRWLPKQLGHRHLFVNQASFTVEVKEGSQTVWTSKVIVGKPNSQTAVFSDVMETVVFNPTWGMPQSILLSEYIHKLRNDPSYLDRKGFHVVNASGKRVPSRAVNWYAVGSGSGIGVIQPAGPGNALGEVKFLFPNSHSIYMHDTPNRELFLEDRRSFSHGCVRVENPRQLAEILLNWDASRVDASIESGKTSSVKVNERVQVHLAYFTAWPDDSGKIKYFSDIYERDQTLFQALKTAEAASSRKQPTQLVQKAGSVAAPTVD